MRPLLLTSLLLLQYANTTYAIDQVQVRAPRVNVRAAPSVESKILTKLSRGKVVQRIATRGKWTKVRVGPKMPLAWIYSPLLSRLPEPFKRFQQHYARLNRLTRSATGRDLFGKVRYGGNDLVYIETSTPWNTMSAKEQTATIESLYQSWKTANHGKPVTLHLYDGKTHHLRSDLTH